MMKIGIRFSASAALISVMLIFPLSASAQSGGGYDLSWSTIDGGGGTFSTGGGFQFGGTAGQPDAGTHDGGGFLLGGGFWKRSLETTGLESPKPVAPLAFRLHPTNPNPFRGTTRIAFDLPEAERVRLSIYSPAGKLVRSLLDEERQPGNYQMAWEGKDQSGREVSRGIYLIHLSAGSFEGRRKVILVNH